MEEQQNVSNFVALQQNLRRVVFVPRCAGTMQLLPNYTDAVHAYNCAMIYLNLCAVLNKIPQSRVLETLLVHDNLEAFTGDLLAPVKDVISDKWDEVEKEVQFRAKDLSGIDFSASVKFETLFPTDEQIASVLTTTEHLLVKCIDMYEYLVRMIEEYKMGNASEQVLHGLKYGTATLRSRMTALKNHIHDDNISLGLLLSNAYSRIVTECSLWEVVE